MCACVYRRVGRVVNVCLCVDRVVNVCLCVQVCGDGSAVSKSKAARIKEPLFKLGHPLPDDGACSHYKKSHRWLR